MDTDQFLKGRHYHDLERYELFYYLLPKYDSSEYYGFAQDGNKLLISEWLEHEDIKEILIGREEILCKNGNSIYVSDSSQPCKENLNWHGKRGFISSGTVYMFDDKYVTIFDEALLKGLRNGNYQNKEFSIEVKKYSDYFDCSANAVPVDNIDCKFVSLYFKIFSSFLMFLF